MNAGNQWLKLPGLTIGFATTDGSAQGAFGAAAMWWKSKPVEVG